MLALTGKTHVSFTEKISHCQYRVCVMAGIVSLTFPIMKCRLKVWIIFLDNDGIIDLLIKRGADKNRLGQIDLPLLFSAIFGKFKNLFFMSFQK